MGYTSNVRCLIYGEPDEMLRFVTAQKLTRPAMFRELSFYLTEHMMDRGERGQMLLDLTLHSTKWYTEYEDVREWMAMLGELDDAIDANSQHPLAFEFIRVGEDDNDIERRMSENAEHYLYTYTNIEADLPPIIEAINDQSSEG